MRERTNGRQVPIGDTRKEENKMKRVSWFGLIGLYLCGVLLGIKVGKILSISYNQNHIYAQITKVVETDTRHDEVICVDEQGNEWIFTGIEEWQVDDIAIMVMDDHKTEKVEDDTIITVTHESRAN